MPLTLTPTSPGSVFLTAPYPLSALGLYNVKDYGAKGDGVTDDAAAINSAWTAASAVNGVLYFPAGNFVYNGAGLDGTQIRCVGVGVGATTVTLGASARFINVSAALSRLLVSGIAFSGGIDVIRSTYTGVNVTMDLVVTDCEFSGYTGAAISDNSTDMPYWKINRCQFTGANYTSTIGIALSGLTDACSITNCDFSENRVHIKLRRGGNNAYIDLCSFIRLGATAGSPRVDVWVVPDSAATNAGQGFTVTATNKFGNENRDAADYFVLYADEGSGSDNGTKFPSLGADSTGYICGHRIGGTYFGIGSALPIVYSTTPNVLGCTFEPARDGLFSYLLQYRTAPAADRFNGNNIFGGFGAYEVFATETAPAPQISNGNGVGYPTDPTGFLATRQAVPLPQPGGSDPADFSRLLATGIRLFTVSNATLSNVTDTFGGADASELNFTSAAGFVYAQLTMGNVTVGQPLWVEFDVKVGGASALTMLRVCLLTESGPTHWQRVLEVPAVWRRVRFLTFPRTAAGQTDVMFQTNQTETGKVQIGRVRVYQCREPVNDGVWEIAQGTNRIFSGTGVPNSGQGVNGDFYFRIDTPGTLNQRLYVRSAGVWTGIL